MYRIKWALALGSMLSLATMARASTCALNTWCFGSKPATESDGATYSTIGGSSVTGTITVYSEQVTNSNNNFYKFSDSTINGLFSTNDSTYDEGIGIAPYDPQEGGSPFPNQEGITNTADGSNTYGNILLLELGSNIAQGTTLEFLIQAGIGAGSDVVSDYYSDSGTVNVPLNEGISPSSMTLNGTTTLGEISTNGTTAQSQLTITKNVSGVEWVAIEADCHYILLDTITGAAPSSSVPEPRFYGLLLASLLGIAGVVCQRRRAAQANA